MTTLSRKWICFGLVVALLAIFPAVMSGCDKKATKDTQIITSLVDGSSSSIPQLVATPKTLVEMYEPQLIFLLNKTLKIDGKTITAGEYNYHCISAFQELSTYAQYGYYPATDTGTLDLAAACDLTEDGSGTWGDYLLEYVREDIQRNYILGVLAKENNMTLSEETRADIDTAMEQIETQAASIGMTGDGYIEQYCGDQMTVERFRVIIESFYLADLYATEFSDNYPFTQAETALPTVRHILYEASRNGVKEQDATDEEIAKALENAESAIALINGYDDMVLIGDKHTRDQTALESAEYTVSKGEMVKEFEEWCFDESRQIGDKAIVRTDYGFHVMFFVGRTEADEEQKKTIVQNALSEVIKERTQETRYTLTESGA